MRTTFAVVAALLTATQAIHIQSLDEFEDRKAELATLRENELESKWTSRIDNYDPNMDQEMASDVLQNLRRQYAIKKLEDKLANSSPKVFSDFTDFDTTKTMLYTLRKEQAEIDGKLEALRPNDFDGTA